MVAALASSAIVIIALLATLLILAYRQQSQLNRDWMAHNRMIAEIAAKHAEAQREHIERLTESLARTEGKVYLPPNRKQDLEPSPGHFDMKPIPPVIKPSGR